MKVKTLINWLQDYDEDTEVMIGMYQRYGSDFAYNIDQIEDDKGFRSFYGEDKEDVIFLIEGEQVGAIADKEDLED